VSQIAQNYRPLDSITPAKLFPGHDELRPEAIASLAGTSHILHFEGQAPVTYSFGENTVSWVSDPSPNVAFPVGEARYEAVRTRAGLLAATIDHPEGNTNTFAVFDLAGQRVLFVRTTMMRGTSSVAERTELFEAGIGGPIQTPFPKTAELVGKRIHWSYGGTHKFEHIYIEPELYCWHGIKGPEANMGAVEPTTVRKIADNLYLFSWCDRAIPFNGALVIDLIDTPSSAGRLVGWDAEKARISQVIVGATGKLVNVTEY